MCDALYLASNCGRGRGEMLRSAEKLAEGVKWGHGFWAGLCYAQGVVRGWPPDSEGAQR